MIGKQELESIFAKSGYDFTEETTNLIHDLLGKGLTTIELQHYFKNLEWYMQVLNGKSYRIDIYPDNLDSALSDLFGNSSFSARRIGLKETPQKRAVGSEHS